MYNETEINIFEDVIDDYKTIKKDIDTRIASGYDIECLCNYIRHLKGCDITNNVQYDDLKFFDFNYCDMCLSIYQEGERQPYLGDSIEVWNDEEMYYIGTFSNIKQIENIIKNRSE